MGEPRPTKPQKPYVANAKRRDKDSKFARMTRARVASAIARYYAYATGDCSENDRTAITISTEQSWSEGCGRAQLTVATLAKLGWLAIPNASHKNP